MEGDKSFELKHFSDLKFDVCGEVLLVRVPVLVEEGL